MKSLVEKELEGLRLFLKEIQVSTFVVQKFHDYNEILFVIFQSHKSAWPFLDPVDASEVPDYYDVVKEPMGKYQIW